MFARLPVRLTIAAGSSFQVGTVAAGLGRRFLLVVDPGLARTPWPERIRGSLRESRLEVTLFDAVPANPRTGTATAAADAARGCDGIVALGGGSVLDTAKAAALLATNPGGIEDYVGRRTFDVAPLPVITLPTTCGTGSEVTWVSVLTQESTQRKISVKGEALFPHTALVDPDLLVSLPSPLVAQTGMDALTHALEATTGARANPFTDALAENAIRRLLRSLPRAHRDIARDAVARHDVMCAATLAGVAFGNADVGAVHCLSESIGGMFDTPHGLTNAILLTAVLRSHLPQIGSRLSELDTLTGGPGNADAFLARLDALHQELELPGFGALGVPSGQFDRIATMAEQNGSNRSNPRPMTARDYRAILDAVSSR